MPEKPPAPSDEDPKDYPDDAYADISFARMAERANNRVTNLEIENQTLEYEAHYDELTGLPNRRQFRKDVDRLVAERPGQFGMLIADIDGLSETNTVYGHPGGDALIVRTADTLRSMTRHHAGRDQDSGAYRLAGDEFATLLAGVHTETDVKSITDRIRGRLAENGVNASVDGRMHVRGESVASLMADIDKMMYAVKYRRKKELMTQEQNEIKRQIGALAVDAGLNLRDVAFMLEFEQAQTPVDDLE